MFRKENVFLSTTIQSTHLQQLKKRYEIYNIIGKSKYYEKSVHQKINRYKYI